MATADRDEAPALDEVNETLRRARELGFFRFVALVERLTRGSVRVGGDGPYAQEAIRFVHDPALTFSTSDLSSARVLSGAPPRFELMSTFLGLSGSVTPLPLYYAEELAEEERGELQRKFIDLFHHRLLSLLYRTTVKYQLDAELTTSGDDAWTRRILALCGLDALTQQPPLELGVLLRLLPALVYARRSPAALQRALAVSLASETAGAPVRVVPFVGAWSPLDERERCRLGVANARLGSELVLGARMFDPAGRFRIQLGPVDADTFARCEPGGPVRRIIDGVVRLFVPDLLPYDVIVTVDRSRRRLALASKGGGGRLGVDAWLGHVDEGHASVHMGDGNQGPRPTNSGATRA